MSLQGSSLGQNCKIRSNFIYTVLSSGPLIFQCPLLSPPCFPECSHPKALMVDNHSRFEALSKALPFTGDQKPNKHKTFNTKGDQIVWQSHDDICQDKAFSHPHKLQSSPLKGNVNKQTNKCLLLYILLIRNLTTLILSSDLCKVKLSLPKMEKI